MDNGLIFPYPQQHDHADPGNAKRLKLRRTSVQVGERATQAGSRQAMG